MYPGYFAFSGKEIFNNARTAAYVKALMPGVEMRCTDTGLRTALGHGTYVSPARDKAPWFQGSRAGTGRFFGFFGLRIEGAQDSTRTLQVDELYTDGAVMTSPRHKAREMRFTADAFALDAEAMNEGIAWLRDVLTGDGCSEADSGCAGRTTQLYTHLPLTRVQAYNARREFYITEVTEGPLVRKQRTSRAGQIWTIEFTVTAARPWAFTTLHEVGLLNMDTAVNFQDPAGENCGVAADPYNDFVDDPYFTGINRPPKPPTILPPNILNIDSWRRKTTPVPANITGRWGRVVPFLEVVNGPTDSQFLRLRFYRAAAGVSGCDFDGEFLISYMPAGSVLTLDGLRRKASMRLANGRTVPAGHLLFGSDGRPFLWPTLGCQQAYTLTADLMPGQPGVVVILKTSIRE